MPSVTSASSAPSAPVASRSRRPQHVPEHALVADEWSAGSTIITSSSGRSTATRGERDRRRGVAPGGLDQHPDVRELGAHELLVSLVGDDRDVDRDAVAIDAGEPPHGRLEQALVAEQRHERLGALRARQRPQAGAAPARHHDHVHRRHSREPLRSRRASACAWSLAAGRRAGSKAGRSRQRPPRSAGRRVTANRTNLATPAALATRTSKRRVRTRVDVVLAASYHPRTGRGRGGRSARVEERV